MFKNGIVYHIEIAKEDSESPEFSSTNLSPSSQLVTQSSVVQGLTGNLEVYGSDSLFEPCEIRLATNITFFAVPTMQCIVGSVCSGPERILELLSKMNTFAWVNYGGQVACTPEKVSNLSKMKWL